MRTTELKSLVGISTICAALSLLGYFGGSFAITTLLDSGGLSARRAALAAQTHRIVPPLPTIPSGAETDVICADPKDYSSERFKKDMFDAASRAGLSISRFGQTPGVLDQGNPKLWAYPFSFTVVGPYTALIQFLERTTSRHPRIFLNALDLGGSPTAASVTVSGKILCYAG